MLSLWLNLRRSLKPRSAPTAKITELSSIDNFQKLSFSTTDEEVFSFPYGTKECVVYKEIGKI